MAQIDWHIIIESWKKDGMGDLGPTLPFIIGALAMKNGCIRPGMSEIKAVLHQMENEPAQGRATIVVWCADIKAPVFQSVTHEFAAHYHKGKTIGLLGPDRVAESVWFGQNLAGRWDCEDACRLIELLALDAEAPVAAKHYSRNPNARMEYEYGEFRAREIAYIRRVLQI